MPCLEGKHAPAQPCGNWSLRDTHCGAYPYCPGSIEVQREARGHAVLRGTLWARRRWIETIMGLLRHYSIQILTFLVL